MVYANADNNLGPNLIGDLVEMMNASLTPEVRVVLYADFPADRLVPGSDDTFPSGAQMIEILGGGDLRMVSATAEEDFDDPAVLTGAVRKVFTAFPAERRGVILWDHGGAWRYGFGGDTQDGTRDGQPMPFEAAAQAVRSGLAAARVSGNPPLEFLAFDTCLLGSPEIAAAFSDLTKVYIAGAEIDYGAGWDYDKALTWLAAHPGAPAADFARQEVAIWDAHHGELATDVLFKSHMALDTSVLPELAAAIRTLVGAVQSTGPVPLKDIGQILVSLAASSDARVASAASGAKAVLGKLVLAQAGGTARNGQSGLNVGAGPPVELTAAMSAEYRRRVTTWNGSSRWADLIDTVRGASDGIAPSISTAGLSGMKLPFRISDADLFSVDFNLWSLGSDRAFLLQLVDRSYPGPGSYEFTWSGNVVALDASPAPVLVSLVPWRDVARRGIATTIYKVIGILESGGDSIYAELLIDEVTMKAEVALVYNGDLPSVIPVAALAGPDVVFWPLFVYLDLADGSADVTSGGTGVSVPGSTVDFTLARVGAGTYAFSLQANDTWGNQAMQFFDFSVP